MKKVIAVAVFLLLLCTAASKNVLAADLSAGNVVILDGANDYVMVQNNGNFFDLPGPISWEVWVYKTDWDDAYQPRGIFSKSEHGTNTGYDIAIDDTSGTKNIYARIGCLSNSYIAKTSRSSLSSGWHHIAATFDGQFVKLYIDGTLRNTTDVGRNCTIEYAYHYELRLGRLARNDGHGLNFWNGKLDEARLYNKVLTPEEISAHYNGGAGVAGVPEANLVAGWHFDENSSNTASDFSGGGHSAFLQNGALWGQRVISANSVSSIAVNSITTNSAVITWQTGAASNSTIDYGATASYGSTATDASSVTSHTMPLSGLSPSTTYHFRITSTDTSNNSAVSADQTFTTLSSAPTDNIFYAAPNGSAAGNGSKDNPWDLYSALRKTTTILPGGTLYLRGGVYYFATTSGQYGYTSLLSGTAQNPITVKSYPGEWAILDGNMEGIATKVGTNLIINGNYTWYRDFEMRNTEIATRKIAVTGSNPSERRANSLDDYGTGNKIINLVIHDTGQGLGVWGSGSNGEYYGNIVFFNGWDAPDRGHGKGIYSQNANGYKRIVNNIFWNDFSGATIRSGGTNDASVNNYWIEGNILFNGGTAMEGPNINNMKIFKNYNFNHSFGVGYEPNNTSYHDAEVKRNYFTRVTQLFDFFSGSTVKYNTFIETDINGGERTYVVGYHPEFVTSDNNTIYNAASHGFPYWALVANNETYAFNKTQGNQTLTYGYVKKSWQDDLGLDLHSTFYDTLKTPTSTVVYYRKNKYDNNRLDVAIYNWSNSASVSIDPSLVLRPGDTYELRSVQDYWNDVTTATYSGGTLNISMNGRNFGTPFGYSSFSSWYHDPLNYGRSTFPKFGAFVLINKTGTTDTARPVVTNVVNDTVKSNSATIWWETDEDSTTRIEYGPTTSYGLSQSPDDGSIYGTFYTTFHEVTLNNLTPGTTYHYRMIDTDYSGNTTTSGDYTFTTTGTPAATPSPSPSSTSAANSGANTGDTGGGASALSATSTVANASTTQDRNNPNLNFGNPACPSPTAKFIPAISDTILNIPFGSRGESVKTLQNLLVKYSYLKSEYVTGYYGPLTRDAVNRYRSYNTVQISTLCATTTTSSGGSSFVASRLPANFRFNKNLSAGITHSDVKSLQIFLNDSGYLVAQKGNGAKGFETTYFGPATKAALIRFQNDNAQTILVPNALTKGTGIFGISTRSVMNSTLAK